MIQPAKETDVPGEEIMPDTGAGQTEIQLKKDRAEVTGTGASVSGSIITITQAGTYSISGVLEDGQTVDIVQDAVSTTVGRSPGRGRK